MFNLTDNLNLVSESSEFTQDDFTDDTVFVKRNDNARSSDILMDLLKRNGLSIDEIEENDFLDACGLVDEFSSSSECEDYSFVVYL